MPQRAAIEAFVFVAAALMFLLLVSVTVGAKAARRPVDKCANNKESISK